MTSVLPAIAAELVKSRRSGVTWGVAAAFSLTPLVGALFMVILKDPESARRLGLLGAKARLTAGTAEWPTFLGLLAQTEAVAGAILFAFLTAWVFGREFADRTVRGLLAISTPRWATVVGKYIVIAGWGVVITVWVVIVGWLSGTLVGLPAWSDDLWRDTLARIAVIALVTIALQSTTAFFASAGRGYIPPLAWAVLTMALAQILAVLGWGHVFPWAVPALVSGVTGPEGETADAVSFLVVGITALVGLLATIAWWERADIAWWERADHTV